MIKETNTHFYTMDWLKKMCFFAHVTAMQNWLAAGKWMLLDSGATIAHDIPKANIFPFNQCLHSNI